MTSRERVDGASMVAASLQERLWGLVSSADPTPELLRDVECLLRLGADPYNPLGGGSGATSAFGAVLGRMARGDLVDEWTDVLMAFVGARPGVLPRCSAGPPLLATGGFSAAGWERASVAPFFHRWARLLEVDTPAGRALCRKLAAGRWMAAANKLPVGARQARLLPCTVAAWTALPQHEGARFAAAFWKTPRKSDLWPDMTIGDYPAAWAIFNMVYRGRLQSIGPNILVSSHSWPALATVPPGHLDWLGDFIRLARDGGVDIDGPATSDGHTLMQFVAAFGTPERALLVLASGVSPTARGAGGLTPAEFADQVGRPDMGRFLRAYESNCDLNVLAHRARRARAANGARCADSGGLT